MSPKLIVAVEIVGVVLQVVHRLDSYKKGTRKIGFSNKEED